MARFSTGVYVFSRRLDRLEAKRCSGKFPSALRKYGLTGQMPEEQVLKMQIQLTIETINAMISTMPKAK